MAVHTLQRTRIIRTTLDRAWSFFSDPRNLEHITPKTLGFEVLSDLPHKTYAGMMIRYRVRPLLGVPVTWLTEITHVNEPCFFIDEQRAGPYRVWHHEHHFCDLGDGRVEMRDLVTYALPFGWLSEPVHQWIVRPRLERIFAFREQAVDELFSCP